MLFRSRLWPIGLSTQQISGNTPPERSRISHHYGGSPEHNVSSCKVVKFDVSPIERHSGPSRCAERTLVTSSTRATMSPASPSCISATDLPWTPYKTMSHRLTTQLAYGIRHSQ